MKIRPFEITDYLTLHNWWKEYDWQSIPLKSLPQTGFIIDDYCAGFLYKTDSDIAWLEWIVSNKNANKKEKSQALDLLITTLTETAKTNGFRVIFTSVAHKGLTEKYKTLGFKETDSRMTNLIKEL